MFGDVKKSIIPGFKIKKGAFVGVSSLVKSDLEPWTIYAGTPCKPIGKREKPTKERNILIQKIDWSHP